jgi:hypothetical protein
MFDSSVSINKSVFIRVIRGYRFGESITSKSKSTITKRRNKP